MRARLLTVAVALGALGLSATGAPETPSPLFSSYDVLPLQLEAPFNELFEHSRTKEELLDALWHWAPR